MLNHHCLLSPPRHSACDKATTLKERARDSTSRRNIVTKKTRSEKKRKSACSFNAEKCQLHTNKVPSVSLVDPSSCFPSALARVPARARAHTDTPPHKDTTTDTHRHRQADRHTHQVYEVEDLTHLHTPTHLDTQTLTYTLPHPHTLVTTT